MAQTVSVQDRLPIGLITKQFELIIPQESITVRDLIRQRVRREVSLYNLSIPGFFQGLVQPAGAQATLSGYQLPQRRPIDGEAQAQAALKAFQRRAFFLVINDRRAESLDELIAIGERTHISFVKQAPLVGG